jgi:hypothetical protein
MAPPTYSPPTLPVPPGAPCLRSVETDSAPNGTTECRGDQPGDIVSARTAWPVAPIRFTLAARRRWVLSGYWYPRLTLLRGARPNSNFVFGTGWWAESGA